MYYKRVLLGKDMLLFPACIISAIPPPPPALMNVLGFCWKRMVLGAQLMTKTTNKSRSYFQRVTVYIYNSICRTKLTHGSPNFGSPNFSSHIYGSHYFGSREFE